MTSYGPTAETDATTREAEGAAEPLDLRQLGKLFQGVVRDADDELAATQRLLQITQRLTKAVAVLYFGEDSTGKLSADPLVLAPRPIAEGTVNKVYSLSMMARSGEVAQIARSDQAPTEVAVAVPVLRLHRSSEVLVILVSIEQDLNRRLAGLVQIGQFLAAFAGQWRGRFDEIRSAGDRLKLDRLCERILESGGGERLSVAASKIADGLQELFSARLVALGFSRAGRQVRLVGLSNGFQFDRSSELGKCLEAVLTETLVGGAHNATDLAGRQTEPVQKLVTMVDGPVVIRSVLPGASGQTVGACVIVGDERTRTHQQGAFELAQRLVGHQLDLISQRPRRPIRKLIRRFRQASRRQKAWVLSVVFAAIVILFMIPIPHRLKCRCEVQPVKRRFVAAPYEGRLQVAYVEPGDWVTEGQTIARMDAREIRLELASVEAEHVRAMKQRDTAMAARETAAAQMARFEMERLELKMKMLQQRMDHLDIKSTTDGVVISGDPKKLEGARLSLGQTLVEVGPLGEMVLEVAIPDEAISYAQLNQSVRYRLESLPHTSFRGVLTKIHPRSEQRESENVFIGEVQIEASDLLRPGMRGRAKIDAEKRSLFWILFHRAWEKVVFSIG